MNARHPARAFGFTLLEVLVAILVLGMIITLIWSAFSRTVESKNYIEAGNEMYHQMRWAINKITYDLSSAYVSKGQKNVSQFIAVSRLNANGIPQDELHFTSFSHIRYSPTERSSDQCELSYFIVQDPASEQFILFRREDYSIDEDLSAGGEVLELVEGIVAFNVRLFDGEEWVEDWDSRNFAELEEDFIEANVEQTEQMIDAIPVAAEIAISMQDERGQEVFLTTKIKLMLSTIDLKGYFEDDDDESNDDSSKTSSSGSSGKTSSSSQGTGKTQ